MMGRKMNSLVWNRKESCQIFPSAVKPEALLRWVAA
jgi:hypothetical protein